MFLKSGNQGQATLEHTEEKLSGMTSSRVLVNRRLKYTIKVESMV